MPLRIATAQSLITADVAANGQHIRALITEARAAGARLVHFPEGALSGYVKAQVTDWAKVDWPAITDELAKTQAMARDLDIWVVLGCNHQLTPPNRPHNSLYVISPAGEILTRYDKRFCSHTEITDWYSPGAEAVVLDIDGVRFGFALCIEVQFPELFAENARLGVECMLFSAYAADPMFAVLAQAHAATNNVWLSLSTPAQCGAALPSRFIGPNGYVAASAPEHAEATVVMGTIDRDDPRYDIALNKARPWRKLARDGEIYRSRAVEDTRSTSRDVL
ncbi:carbon-nitrogen hydrolase family protein [Devosia aquimaris]|uniref:carbon-nitrogen hydrolase family protein n=1 Tax=Devosia aquimaris TaxID=2866214 RepID=UPI001CD10D48|nr:carbon-nitrogen hydrolase family protein [Devosia sp. CJK-A8-3]